jgi:hypothetical protein
VTREDGLERGNTIGVSFLDTTIKESDRVCNGGVDSIPKISRIVAIGGVIATKE